MTQKAEEFLEELYNTIEQMEFDLYRKYCSSTITKVEGECIERFRGKLTRLMQDIRIFQAVKNQTKTP